MLLERYISSRKTRRIRQLARDIYPKSSLLRVSKNNPCSVCGKPDWCSFSSDGAIAFCMRESAGSVKQASNGAYIHTQTNAQVTSAVSAPLIRDCGNCGSGRADADHLHRVYSYLLTDCLQLTAAHGDHLLSKRGLSDMTVAANLYASIPGLKDWDDMCWAMHNRFGDELHGVPGFYKRKVRWMMPRQPPGFFVPYRDVKGRIVGLQIRRDEDLKPKYLWFSTNPVKFQCGTSSGTPVHFAKPDFAQRTGIALITEGALKADCISEFKDVTVIAVAGVTAVSPDSLDIKLRQSIPQLQNLMMVFDMDWQENSAVMDALRRMVRGLKTAGFTIKVRTWDISFGKGHDDALSWKDKVTV